MRWTSSAHNSKTVRERFSTIYTVTGTVLAFGLLLALLYPEDRLLEILNKSKTADAATVRYLESLLRVRPDDNSLRIRLAGELLRAGNPEKAFDVMTRFSAGLTRPEQRKVLELRYRALKEILLSANQDRRLPKHKAAFAETARQLAHGNMVQWELRNFAEDAKKAGDPDGWRYFNKRAALLDVAVNKAAVDATPGDPFALALGQGNYRLAASICFNDMKAAGSRDKRRELFFKGVRTLQSGNLPVEALEAGERHMTELSNDRETLIFLTRVGLAAGKPDRAQHFIRRALQMKEKPVSAEVS